MDDETTLADLMSLNLHDYEDEVVSIVDKVNTYFITLSHCLRVGVT